MNKNNIAVVIGNSGSIGSAIEKELSDQGFKNIIGFNRSSSPRLDLLNEETIAQSAQFIKDQNTPVSLVFDATGLLHDDNNMPEKTYKNIDQIFMRKNFEINVMGPALIMKYFLPLLDKEEKSIFASISAKVGSISDNRYGGWYSYRASKAALNQMIKTASIEMKMKNQNAICLAIHPGTVESKLSKPFQKNDLTIQSPQESASNIFKILTSSTSKDTGSFYNWDGKIIDW
jgi:NAD(P)-dependent dehydrogenase (short-subunit alcohol dehydrogenase family)